MRRVMLLLGAMAMLATVSACFLDDDDDGDGASATRPTMTNIWPHADGSTWTYEMNVRSYDLQALDTGPDLPSMEELHALLERPAAADVLTDTTLFYTLTLDGDMTTASGVTAQRLVTTNEPLVPPVTAGPVGSMAATSSEFAWSIAMARPDLRDGLISLAGREYGEAKDDLRVLRPQFLGGHAFAFEDSGYYGYGDVYPEHSWVHLEGDLSVGSEFSLQLLVGVADDIRLQGRIWSVENFRLDGVTYGNVVECMYVLDLGEYDVLEGTVHSYVYGVTWYVPGIGPVGCREQARVQVRTAYDSEGTGEIMVWTTECRISDFTLPAVD